MTGGGKKNRKGRRTRRTKGLGGYVGRKNRTWGVKVGGRTVHLRTCRREDQGKWAKRIPKGKEVDDRWGEEPQKERKDLKKKNQDQKLDIQADKVNSRYACPPTSTDSAVICLRAAGSLSAF